VVNDEYEYGMTSDRDNGSTRRKHRTVSFCPLQILNNLAIISMYSVEYCTSFHIYMSFFINHVKNLGMKCPLRI